MLAFHDYSAHDFTPKDGPETRQIFRHIRHRGQRDSALIHTCQCHRS